MLYVDMASEDIEVLLLELNLAPNHPDDPDGDWQALPPPTSVQIKGDQA